MVAHQVLSARLGVAEIFPSDPIGDNEPSGRRDKKGYEVFIMSVGT